ncbi:MAG: dipeptidase [Limimaricola sp.]|uniref:dipeptidase n=1 Tax=Limimaricola sp. TaxID=2211665 RepID=UPI001DDCB9A5|nr:dipeptidase [Limimaricola sp.]MBI1417038.1 dipeptidase [Limimaricola sp.]
MTVETYLAEHEAEAVATLLDFCRIPSVSTDPAFAGDVARAAAFVADRLRAAGFDHVEEVPTGGHPCVFAEWIVDPAKPTVLIYGHYDVQPPDPVEKWRTPPFDPVVSRDRVWARGASDDKGPMLIPILVAAAFGKVEGAPPLNLKVLIEGEEESGSPHFEPTVARMKDRLACDVVVSADGAMWRADLPSMTVATRGMSALEVTVTGAEKDLHSGRHGGTAPNPIRALARMLATLHDDDGAVIVPGFEDGARRPDPAISRAIAEVGFDAAGYFRGIGADLLDPLPGGAALLTRQWLRPTLEFNGISGGYQGAGTKTVIPSSASVKITCRLIAGQQPARVADAIEAHLRAVLPPGYRLVVHRHGPGTEAFAIDPDLPALATAEAVLGEALGAAPLRVAMGATVPIGDVFTRQLGVGAIFFSFATSDEDYHAPNEFFRLSSFRTGQQAWAALLRRLADGGL